MSITFLHHGPDKAELRRTIEKDFGGSEVSVGCDFLLEQSHPPKTGLSNTDDPVLGSVLSVVRDQRIAALRDIAEAVEAPRPVTLYALKKLIECGDIRRVDQGFYVLRGAPDPRREEIEELRGRRRRTKSGIVEDDILNWLIIPHSAKEAEEYFNVTRQRAHQILNGLSDRGRIAKEVCRGVAYFCVDREVLRVTLDELACQKRSKL